MPKLQTKPMLRLLLLVSAALLAGCFHKESDGRIPRSLTRDVIIESPVPRADNGNPTTRITATVFLPENNPDGPYPLIVHSHGWGGSRVSAQDANRLFETREDTSSPDVLVPLLWDAGYAVISYDQRGFGRGDDGDNGTEDGSHGMSPNFEIEDAKAVIDWAVANLNPVLDAPGDPRVGMVGFSYGGALQLMTAAEDARVDAIVPGITWFDLSQSLAPNDVLKKGWLLVICDVAVNQDNAQLSAEIQQACDQVNAPSARELADAPVTENLFFENGLSFYSEQPGFSMPAVPALITHGNRDILFNQNQADAMFRYLSGAGGDVKLLLHEAGHEVPANRRGPGSPPPLGDAFCGSIDVAQVPRQWLDEKLRGAPATGLPTVCLSLDNDRAIHLDAIPRGTSDYRVTVFPSTVTGISENNDRSPADEALFFPLGDPISEDGLVVAGIPRAKLTVQAGPGNSDPTPMSGFNAAGVFVGVGILRGNQRLLVDGQVQPILSTDSRTGATPDEIELVGVGEALEVGDQVGVLLYGKHDEYENHPGNDPSQGTNWRDNVAIVSGTVDLPIFPADTVDTRP